MHEDDYLSEMMRLNNEMVEQKEAEQKAMRKHAMLMSFRKWAADNIVGFLALIVSIIALVRSF
jgi:hypothetical protein